jgi:hypothetical protein
LPTLYKLGRNYFHSFPNDVKRELRCTLLKRIRFYLNVDWVIKFSLWEFTYDMF